MVSANRNAVSCNVGPLSIMIGLGVGLLTHSVLWGVFAGLFWWVPLMALLGALALVLSAIEHASIASSRRKRLKRQKRSK
jgi:hypothetical protein